MGLPIGSHTGYLIICLTIMIDAIMYDEYYCCTPILLNNNIIFLQFSSLDSVLTSLCLDLRQDRARVCVNNSQKDYFSIADLKSMA